MPLSPRVRALRATRLTGVPAAAAALCLAVAGSASACSIRDFSASAECGADGHGFIRVTDVDPTGTPATVSVQVKLSMPDDQYRDIGSRTIERSGAQGTSVDIPVDWTPDWTYKVHVKAGAYVDEDITPMLTTPSRACPAWYPSPSPTPSASDTPSTAPSTAPAHAPAPGDSPSPTPSDSGSTPASNAPAPAGGSTHLAETGAGSYTAPVAGIAVGMVVVGAGTVFALRRRKAAAGD
ncbi:LPXTG cell wall anchor domain-containing protein [Streptomyces roseirectus]|uniref:LPXTG cell wall anchor domain-containing protein n=1 Tax=Streptomyces roseirectus TaxID=2768066 RepID=A0A7H0IAT2_9ACTN|nr:LAETG motif-containing sortase-dependent surface protein [Streptomyces roseirectus]QNP69898.1 LPXTG cell wall anchor domain-containing protein [Streptomyces roseirectus]